MSNLQPTTGRLRVRVIRILGIALILLGALALIFRRITYTTRRDTVNVGPIHTEVETKRTVPLPPLFGALTIVGGVLLIVAARKQ